jgi:hypothetical protein
LSYDSFARALRKNLRANKEILPQIEVRSWKSVSAMYLKESLSDLLVDPKLTYAQAF